MEYKSKNSGLLKVTDVKEGDKLVLTEPAYEQFSESKQKSYWNCKVKLPNGEVKLAGIMDSTMDVFAGKWGTETNEWTGRIAIVAIKLSKSSNNPYITLIPTDEKEESVLVTAQKIASGVPLAEGIEYPSEDINPADIPF